MNLVCYFGKCLWFMFAIYRWIDLVFSCRILRPTKEFGYCIETIFVLGSGKPMREIRHLIEFFNAAQTLIFSNSSS